MNDLGGWKLRMQSGDSYDRSSAADNPPKTGNEEEIASYLIAALHNDSDENVRTCAADSLGYFHLNDVRGALREALEKETNEVTLSYIVTSLGMIGEIKDLSALIQKLNSTAFSPRVQCSLREAIMNITSAIFTREMFEICMGADDGANAAAVMGLTRTAENWITAIDRMLNFTKELFHRTNARVLEEDLEKMSTVQIGGLLGEVSWKGPPLSSKFK